MLWNGANFVSQSGNSPGSYPSQPKDCFIWPCRKTQKKPKTPKQLKTTLNQSILQATKLVWSLLLPVLFPVSPWGGVSASQRPLLLAVLILFSGREVCPLSDLPFFSSLLSHPPMGCVMLVDGLQLYHTLTSTQEMRLICWEHDWKLPRRSLNALGLWRVRWIKATQRGATVWTIGATFFSFFTNKPHIGKK